MKISYHIIFILTALSLSACTKYWTESETIGVFKITKYQKMEPLKQTYSYMTEICSNISDFCMKEQGLSVLKTSGDVFFILKKKDQTRIPFNSKTGERIECTNCTKENEFNRILSSSNYFTWANDSKQFLVVDSSSWHYKKAVQWKYEKAEAKKERENYNNLNYHIWLLDVVQKGFKVTEVSPSSNTYNYGEPLNPQYSPDFKQIAWHLCDPTCNLWLYNIESGKYHSFETPCKHKKFTDSWVIDWESGEPETAYKNGFADGRWCLNATGGPAFRVLDD